MTPSNQQPEQPEWLTFFMKELVSRHGRHSVVLLIATLLLIPLEVEATEGWHLVHILQVVSLMGLFYLAWAAWRSSKERRCPIR